MANAKGGNSPREKARAARLAAEAASRRRDRMIRIGGAVVVLLVVAGIIVGAVMTSKKDTANGGADPTAPLPAGVNSETFAYQVTQNPSASAPTVQVWEDFQCPACKQFEETLAPTLFDAAKKGEVNLQLRPTTFLDAKLPQSKLTSARATAAWGCAADAGKGVEYHTEVFRNQPAVEGTEIKQDQLVQYGQSVGIAGDGFNKFAACVDELKYKGWAANSTAEFERAAVPGTPAVYVNGKELSLKGISSPQQLLEKIKSMAA